GAQPGLEEGSRPPARDGPRERRDALSEEPGVSDAAVVGGETNIRVRVRDRRLEFLRRGLVRSRQDAGWLALVVAIAAGCRTDAQSEKRDDVRAAAAHPTSPGPLHDLDWLAGCWQGSQGDKLVEETWTEPAVDRMIASGRTVDVSSGKTVWFEFL